MIKNTLHNMKLKKKKPAKFTNSSEKKFLHYILIEILIVEN